MTPPAEYPRVARASADSGAAPAAHDFPPVLTAAMAAELLQIHVEYLRKMVRDGRIPCHRFPGGRELRFLRDELIAWLGDQPAHDRQPYDGPGGQLGVDEARTAGFSRLGPPS